MERWNLEKLITKHVIDEWAIIDYKTLLNYQWEGKSRRATTIEREDERERLVSRHHSTRERGLAMEKSF